MTSLGVKNSRKIFDSFVVLITAVSAFVIGYIENMGFGALTTALILPSIFLLTLFFMHLVLRKGRKFDEDIHDRKQELVNAFVFLGLIASYYVSGLSESILPGNIIYVVLTAVFSLLALYFLAYRPNN